MMSRTDLVNCDSVDSAVVTFCSEWQMVAEMENKLRLMIARNPAMKHDAMYCDKE